MQARHPLETRKTVEEAGNAVHVVASVLLIRLGDAEEDQQSGFVERASLEEVIGGGHDAHLFGGVTREAGWRCTLALHLVAAVRRGVHSVEAVDKVEDLGDVWMNDVRLYDVVGRSKRRRRAQQPLLDAVSVWQFLNGRVSREELEVRLRPRSVILQRPYSLTRRRHAVEEARYAIHIVAPVLLVRFRHAQQDQWRCFVQGASLEEVVGGGDDAHFSGGVTRETGQYISIALSLS